MSKKKVIRYLTIPEVRAMLEEMWIGIESELNDVQKSVLNYVRDFSKMSKEKAIELLNFLVNEIGIKEELAVQIVNTAPLSRSELRALIFKDYPLLETKKYDEIIKKIKESI